MDESPKILIVYDEQHGDTSGRQIGVRAVVDQPTDLLFITRLGCIVSPLALKIFNGVKVPRSCGLPSVAKHRAGHGVINKLASRHTEEKIKRECTISVTAAYHPGVRTACERARPGSASAGRIKQLWKGLVEGKT